MKENIGGNDLDFGGNIELVENVEFEEDIQANIQDNNPENNQGDIQGGDQPNIQVNNPENNQDNNLENKQEDIQSNIQNKENDKESELQNAIGADIANKGNVPKVDASKEADNVPKKNEGEINTNVNINTDAKKQAKDEDVMVEGFVDVKKGYYHQKKPFNVSDINFKGVNEIDDDTREELYDVEETYNAQKNEYDALRFAIDYNSYQFSVQTLKDMKKEDVDALKASGIRTMNAAQYNIVGQFETALNNHAFLSIIGNDGIDGVKKLIRYLGVLNIKGLVDIGKDIKEATKEFDDADKEVREMKATYLINRSNTKSKSFDSTIKAMLTDFSNEVVPMIGRNWGKELFEGAGIHKDITYGEYLEKFGRVYDPKSGYSKNEKMIDVYRKSEDAPDLSDEEAYRGIIESGIDRLVFNMIKAEQNNTEKYLSSEEKECLRLGHIGSGLDPVANNYPKDPRLADWFVKEGKQPSRMDQKIYEYSSKKQAECIRELNKEFKSKKHIPYMNEVIVSESLMQEVGDTKYLEGVIKNLKDTGKGQSKAGWHKNNSALYEKMLKSIEDYKRAIDEGRGGTALELKEVMVKNCKDYIKDKKSIRSTDFGKDRFDIVMTVLMKNMDPNEYGILLKSINKKRGAKNDEYEGFVNREYYKAKEQDYITDVTSTPIESYVEGGLAQLVDEKKAYYRGIIETLSDNDNETRAFKSESYKKMVRDIKRYEATINKGAFDQALLDQMMASARSYALEVAKDVKTPSDDVRFKAAIAAATKQMRRDEANELISILFAMRDVKDNDKNYANGKVGNFRSLIEKEYPDYVIKVINRKEIERDAINQPFDSDEGAGLNLYYLDEVYAKDPILDYDKFSYDDMRKLTKIEDKFPEINGNGELPKDDFVTIAYAAAFLPEVQKKGLNDDKFGTEANIRLHAFEHTHKMMKEDKSPETLKYLDTVNEARMSAADSMRKYVSGDKHALAATLAQGIHVICDWINGYNGFSESLMADAAMANRMLKLLEKDKELMKEALREGLTSEDIRFVKNAKVAADMNYQGDRSIEALYHYGRESTPGKVETVTDIIVMNIVNDNMKKTNKEKEKTPEYVNRKNELTTALQNGEITPEDVNKQLTALKYSIRTKDPVFDNLSNEENMKSMRDTVKNFINRTGLCNHSPETIMKNLRGKDMMQLMAQDIAEANNNARKKGKKTVVFNTENNLDKKPVK